jgi:hypothetical protein
MLLFRQISPSFSRHVYSPVAATLRVTTASGFEFRVLPLEFFATTPPMSFSISLPIALSNLQLADTDTVDLAGDE